MINLILNQQTPIATEKADPVADKALINECLAYVKTLKECAGMAANQLSKDGIRINKRFFFARKDVLTQEWITILNPVITEYKGKNAIIIEGCLTWRKTELINGVEKTTERKLYVRRWMNISVYYTTVEGIDMEGEMEGFTAQVFQHETDHLNGVQEHFMDEKSETIQMRNELCACGSGKKYKKCCGAILQN